MKVTISKRRATVVYSRANNTILDLSSFSAPEPTDYGPGDFFPIYDMAMANNSDVGTGIDYLSWVTGQVFIDSTYDLQMLLMQLISVPVGIFNDPTFLNTYPPENHNVSGSLSSPSYRVIEPI